MKTVIDEHGIEREVVGTCGCGKPLIRGDEFIYLGVARKSVTHTLEDEGHHIEYFSGIKVLSTNLN